MKANHMTHNGLLLPAEAASYLRLTKDWLARHRRMGDGPVFVKINHLVRYRIADLDEWVDLRRCISTRYAVANFGGVLNAPQGMVVWLEHRSGNG